MNNTTITNKENIIRLSYPVVFDININSTTFKDYKKTLKTDEKINLFSSNTDNKLFVKPDRKNKKNEKEEHRDTDIGKTKLKSKKKEKSKFRKDDYETLHQVNTQSTQIYDLSLPFARPEPQTKKTVLMTIPENTKQGTKSTIKKTRKQEFLKNKELEQKNFEKPEQISIKGPVSVQELALLLFVSETEIIRSLFVKGIAVTINQILDVNTIQTVGEDLGIQIEHVKEFNEENKKIKIHETNSKYLEKRPPVIAIMGHVDHGKTTLLDKIRKTQTAQKEAGGITQKIGAYEVEIQYKEKAQKLTFLDTPGHEAFSGMRSRGVQVTDIAILVVAADDGVKPQTVEAIKYIQSAKVPIIVAINKIDKENADIENIKQQLTQYNLIPENWGGDTPMVPISAMKGTNMEKLLEMIILVSEVEDLKANPSGKAQGTILEAYLDRTKGGCSHYNSTKWDIKNW